MKDYLNHYKIELSINIGNREEKIAVNFTSKDTDIEIVKDEIYDYAKNVMGYWDTKILKIEQI